MFLFLLMKIEFQEDQKFLGKMLFFTGKSEETFKYIKDIVDKQFENIDKLAVRDEYKL
jgi:hypothetical protein